jgi:eukaryotic-like serine/threonine-protein kinase
MIAAGTRLGPYEILSQLGAGGMGEVYRARDTRLNRTITLKILPAAVASNPDRMRRFLGEAKAASALNHPNIATVHDMGDSEGISYIAMEYVEGQTLATQIKGRPLDPAEIVQIGLQIADALEEAHTKGITHRDIKPANLMLTPRGQVKVLDFGLAKVSRLGEQAVISDLSTLVKTETGVVLGTVGYMSPEQVLGKEVDPRSDLFSLGVVLYEMATGRLPFSGASANETMDHILHAPPEAMARFNYNIPAELERVVRKGLEKDRERRYQSARELLIDLRNLKRDMESGTGVIEKAAPRLRNNVSHFVVALLAVAILALGGIGLFLLSRRAKATPKAMDSLAVLPFVNASADPGMEYLSDGITESMISTLSQLSNLKVMSRSTAFHYKGREVDPKAVGRELSVRGVLMGRVVQRGDNLSISAELVDAQDDSQIWGEQYNRKFSDLLAVQGDIVKDISEKLRLKLSGEEQQRLAKRSTDNPEAYQLYLKGRYFTAKFTREGSNKAIGYFQQAIAIDPSYAPAYAGLANDYLLAADWFMSPKEAMPKARDAVQKALKLDDRLAEAHTSLGALHFCYEWDWLAAEGEFKRAIELNPNYVLAHQWFGWYLVAMGRFDQAIAEVKRAQQLDPLSLEANSFLGVSLCFARRDEEAIEQLRKTIDMDPNYWFAYLWLGRAYEQKGELDKAIAAFQKAKPTEESNPELLAELGHAYAVSGQKGEAQKVLDQLNQHSKQSYFTPYFIATIFTGLGEKKQAFGWLERAYQERSAFLTWLKVDPNLDSLRPDPRFADLLQRVGLPP